MFTLYGPVGVPATIAPPPVQVEIRPDGTAYRWICTGAPTDGSLATPCPLAARSGCIVGSSAWNGSSWQLSFRAEDLGVSGVPDQGKVTSDGNGHILIGYIYYTFSGGLFWRVGDPSPAGAVCVLP